MKKKLSFFTLVVGLAIVAISCNEDLLLKERNDGLTNSVLTDQSVLLKLSYIENSQRFAELPEGKAEELELYHLEEPTSYRKSIYIEIYEDFSIGKQVDYLPSEMNYPQDQWKLPSDMPDVVKTTYLNGLVKGYDEKGKLILEDTYEESLWVNPEDFGSIEDAQRFVVNSYYDAPSMANYSIDRAKEGANSYTQVSDRVLELTNTIYSGQNNARGAVDLNEVVEQKMFMLQDYGVVYRVEGYDVNGELQNVEHNFYQLNEDAVLLMKSSHFRNFYYSEAYDITYLEYSDIFYEDFRIETSLDLSK